MVHQRKLRQNVGLENMNMTSNYDVTNNAYQIQMTPYTTACHSPWKSSAYSTTDIDCKEHRADREFTASRLSQTPLLASFTSKRWFWFKLEASNFFKNKLSRLVKSMKAGFYLEQWRAEVWWCPRRRLDYMPLSNSSFEQWRTMVTEHTVQAWIWRHSVTSHSRLQINILVKLLTQHACYSTQGRRNSGRAGE